MHTLFLSQVAFRYLLAKNVGNIVWERELPLFEGCCEANEIELRQLLYVP